MNSEESYINTFAKSTQKLTVQEMWQGVGMFFSTVPFFKPPFYSFHKGASPLAASYFISIF
jgi:hypothetical protein